MHLMTLVVKFLPFMSGCHIHLEYRNDLSFRTNRSDQTVQTQIRLLLEEQSDQGLHCLLFRLLRFDEIP